MKETAKRNATGLRFHLKRSTCCWSLLHSSRITTKTRSCRTNQVGFCDEKRNYIQIHNNATVTILRQRIYTDKIRVRTMDRPSVLDVRSTRILNKFFFLRNFNSYYCEIVCSVLNEFHGLPREMSDGDVPTGQKKLQRITARNLGNNSFFSNQKQSVNFFFGWENPFRPSILLYWVCFSLQNTYIIKSEWFAFLRLIAQW